MATYYVRADGLVSAANKHQATSPTSPTTSLSIASLNAASFVDDDRIIFSSQGGVYSLLTSLFLPGGTLSPIYISNNDYENELPIFDGGGDGNAGVGVGPLIYASYTLGAEKYVEITKLKLRNWKYNTWGLVPQNGYVVLDDIHFEAIGGQTAIETLGGGGVVIKNMHNFLGSYTTHLIGLHGSADVLITDCSGMGGVVNVVHAIENVDVTIKNFVATSNPAGGTHAFSLGNSGRKLINDSKITINRESYSAVYSNLLDPTTVNNCIVRFTSGSDYSAAFNVSYYSASPGNIIANNCLIYSEAGLDTVGAKLNEGNSATGAAITMNNCNVCGTNVVGRINGASSTLTLNSCNLYNNTSLSIGAGILVNNNPLNVDPLFVDAANGNFHLKSNSPCIEAGAIIPGIHDQATPATDFDGAIVCFTPNIGPYGQGAIKTITSNYSPTGYGVREGATVVLGAHGLSVDFTGLTLSENDIRVKEAGTYRVHSFTRKPGTSQYVYGSNSGGSCGGIFGSNFG